MSTSPQRNISLNITVPGDEEEASDSKHAELQRSITSEAIAMIADDNEPIITPSSVQETIDNQLKSRWRFIRSSVKRHQFRKSRISPVRATFPKMFPKTGGPNSQMAADSQMTANGQLMPLDTAEQVAGNDPDSVDIDDPNDPDSVDIEKPTWRHPEQMRCVLSCLLLGMRGLNLALLVVGLLITFTAWLVTLISDAPQAGFVLVGFGIFVVIVCVTMGPFFCCCCGTSSYTCCFEVEGYLAIFYAAFVFIIFVCSSAFAGFILLDGWNDRVSPYRMMFGQRKNVTATKLFEPLHSFGIPVSPQPAMLPLAFVILVGVTLAVTVFSALYSICLFKSYAVKAEHEKDLLLRSMDRDLEERDMEQRMSLSEKVESSSPQRDSNAQDLAAVVAAEVAHAMEAAKEESAELQAGIAKEKEETAKEHERVQQLNSQLSLMQERVKALERSASQQQLNDAAKDSDKNGGSTSKDDEEDENKLCVVCWENPKNALLLPCKHLCTCHDCATAVNSKGVRNMQQCPVCRVNIFDIEKVFMT